KATKIDEVLIENDAERVYGIVYDFKGETASDLQFFLTDSTNHFLRGSLYFNVYPNKDSLAPVIDYVKTDINHMLESFKWLN
ncbi:MAG: gliding motility lipoprotein GldD, partial [Salibacteraceae bacterium]|nr:gliding motility lipoprotein GldD [Salibacteraceae bacterium]